MPRGGARNRSGPQPAEDSGRSDRRGFKLTALPAEGYEGSAPEFPLPARAVYRWETEDKRRYQVLDSDATELVADREQQLWEWAWSTPQACAWSMPSESWRLMTIAHWVRTAVLCESSEATAADKGSLHRFADQIGMTPAGLKENGWKVAPDETAQRRESRSSKEPTRKSSRDRMKVMAGGA